MKCSAVEKLLEAYFEHLISRRKSELVAAHVEQCSACARKLAQIAKVAGALAAAPRSEPGVDLLGRISAQVAALPSPAPRYPVVLGWRRLVVLAGAFVVALAAWQYALPLIVSREAAQVALLGYAKLTLSHASVWAVALFDALHRFWLALRGLPGALRLAATAIAPTIGLYAVGEVGIITLVIVLGHRARRARPIPLPVLL